MRVLFNLLRIHEAEEEHTHYLDGYQLKILSSPEYLIVDEGAKFSKAFALRTLMAQAIRLDPGEEDLVVLIDRPLSSQVASALQVRISDATNGSGGSYALPVESVDDRELRVPAPLLLRGAAAKGVFVEVWHGTTGRLSNVAHLQITSPHSGAVSDQSSSEFPQQCPAQIQGSGLDGFVDLKDQELK